MYKGAAVYFEPFDLDEMAATFQNLARVVYETGRRSLEPTYWVAQKLLEEAVSRYPSNGKPEVLGGIYFRLSLVLRNQVAHADKIEAEGFLVDASECSRKAVLTLSNTDDIFAIVSSQISLGNCLLDAARFKSDAETSDQAVAVFEEARKAALKNEELVGLLGHSCNGLGAALLQVDAVTSSEANNGELKNRAVVAFEEAVSASSRIFDPEIWGIAQINLGRLLAEAAESQECGEGEASFLRIRAITSFVAAIETFPEVQFPMPFAAAHSGLAEVLFEHGLSANDHLFEMYFTRALHSFNQVAEIHSKENSPLRWAQMQCRLGSVFGNHAMRVDGETAEHDLEMAISYFDAGLEVFEELEDKEREESCVKNLAVLRTQLEGLK